MRLIALIGLAAFASPAAAADSPSGVHWIKDDYAKARDAARAANKPLVIDLWAPWCHTCLSMKATVLADARLAPRADKFVWLALDTDRPANAGALIKFAPAAWPTFYVVSPADESIQARLVGGAPLDQFAAFLDEGAAGHAKASLPPHAQAATAGDRASARGDHAAALTHFLDALSKAPGDWARRPGLLVSIQAARYKLEAWDDCAAFAIKHQSEATVGATASAADFAWYSSVCADKIKDAARAEQVRKVGAAAIIKITRDPKAQLSADDRSDALRILRELHDALGNKAAAKAAAEQQRAVLDAAAAGSRDARQAMTWHWPRAEVYVYLGVPEQLVPELEASVKALPAEYDPPYRLAWVQMQRGEHTAALSLAQTALGRVYGPRKGRVLWLIADLHAALKDEAAERAARKAVVDWYAGLPEGHRSDASLAAAHKALAKLDAPQ